MKKGTKDQLKKLIEIHAEDEDLSNAIQFLKMIANSNNEPNPVDKGVAWIKWHRELTGSSLLDARNAMWERREELNAERK